MREWRRKSLHEFIAEVILYLSRRGHQLSCPLWASQVSLNRRLTCICTPVLDGGGLQDTFPLLHGGEQAGFGKLEYVSVEYDQSRQQRKECIGCNYL